MLQKLNERIQGLIAWVVIILIAVTFTLFGVDYYMQSRQASDAEIEVNGQPISKQTFELNYRRARQQRESAPTTAVQEAALKKKVMTDIVTQEVSVQAARKAGFDVNDELANAAILSIPQFQEDGRFSEMRYHQALSGAMFTPESFRKEVKQGMLLNQQRFAFMGSVFALPEETKRFVRLYLQTRDYQYLTIPTALFIKNNQISEEEAKAYYDAHPKDFYTPEQVSIEYVNLSIKPIKDRIKVSPEEVKRYFEENKSNYLTPAQWKVAHILFALPANASEEMEKQVKSKADAAYEILQKDPKQFSELVKTQSDDKLSIAQQGVLPWLIAGQSGFDKILATLAKPGDMSAPFKSEHGYEIFKLVAYKPAVQKTLDEVDNQIKEQLSNDLAQTQYGQYLEQLGDLSYQSPDSLTPVADALKLPVETTAPFSRQGGESELTKNKQVIDAAFSSDVLELGNNSEPVQLRNDSVIVLRVKKHIPAARKPFAEVKEEISQQLALAKAMKQAEELGQRFLANRTDEQQQEKLRQSNQLQWQTVAKSSRDSDKTDPVINELAFNIARAPGMEGRRLNNGDFVLVRLNKINDGQLEALDKEQQANLVQQIESNFGVMDYELYINNLVANAHIEKP